MQVQSVNDLDALAKDAAQHLDRLGIPRTDFVRVGKCSEEGGEVLGALIKRTYGAATTEDVLDELGDVFLAALGAAEQLGVLPSEVIAARWAKVRTRSSGTPRVPSLGAALVTNPNRRLGPV